MSDARSLYTAGREARARDVKEQDRKAHALGTARLVVALAVVALLVGMVWAHLPRAAGGAVAALVAAFIALGVWHAVVQGRRERAMAAMRFHERGLARLDGAWQQFVSTGERFDRDDHAYADDLDVFGRASLFQLLDATETRFGEERLAAWLGGDAPASMDALRARQEAVRELAPLLDFRERLSAIGALTAEDKPDPRPFLTWAEGAMPMTLAPVLAPVARVLPVITVAMIAAAYVKGLPALVWLLPLLIEVAVLAMTSRQVSPIATTASTREGALGRYAEMLELMEQLPAKSPVLRALQEKLRASGASATIEMRRLRNILNYLDVRNNEVWRIFIGPVLLWDLNCVISLERWRVRVGSGVRAWFDAIGELEALASVAGFAFERPDHAYPELGEEPRFEATLLGHPLIGAAKRVSNDVALHGRGEALVVTGSNMSGKSTLLRAIGINAVLALMGAPVCAKRLAFGPLEVVTSMRVRDSLEEGVSRFYAEVRKLKRVIDRARSGKPTLFLLDEILHGTNSRERLIGARAIVRELLARGASGAVSTHDLALGDLEEAHPERVTNVHFEEQVSGDTMTFDYKLRLGVVKSSNALRIMRMVGIDVVEPS